MESWKRKKMNVVLSLWILEKEKKKIECGSKFWKNISKNPRIFLKDLLLSWIFANAFNFILNVNIEIWILIVFELDPFLWSSGGLKKRLDVVLNFERLEKKKMIGCGYKFVSFRKGKKKIGCCSKFWRIGKEKKMIGCGFKFLRIGK